MTEPFLDGFGGEAKPGEPLHDMWLRLAASRRRRQLRHEGGGSRHRRGSLRFAFGDASVVPKTRRHLPGMEPQGAREVGRRTRLHASSRSADRRRGLPSLALIRACQPRPQGAGQTAARRMSRLSFGRRADLLPRILDEKERAGFVGRADAPDGRGRSGIRRQRRYRERVNGAGQFFSENVVDHALTIDARPAPERLGRDLDAEMSLAFGTRARMSGMHVRFVDDFEPGRRKGFSQFLPYGFGYRHSHPAAKPVDRRFPFADRRRLPLVRRRSYDANFFASTGLRRRLRCAIFCWPAAWSAPRESLRPPPSRSARAARMLNFQNEGRISLRRCAANPG